MRELALEHMTMLVVTHEMGFAREVAHRVAFMDRGELIEIGPSAEFFAHPRHARTQAFLHNML
ncbi:Glutamine transport ATP-binding protein GlnQ [compost metagenome]